VVRIVGALQQLLGPTCLGCVLENTAVQHNFRSPSMVARDWPLITLSGAGRASATGCCASRLQCARLRNYWTNLASSQQLTSVLRHDGRLQGWVVQGSDRPDAAPFFPVNFVGQPRRAWPTLVAYPQSRAFRPGRQGSLSLRLPLARMWSRPLMSASER
jgi:hypothetical protein